MASVRGRAGRRRARAEGRQAAAGNLRFARLFDELAGFGSQAQAVAAFYVYESQVPENLHPEDRRAEGYQNWNCLRFWPISRCTKRLMSAIVARGAIGWLSSRLRTPSTFWPLESAH